MLSEKNTRYCIVTCLCFLLFNIQSLFANELTIRTVLEKKFEQKLDKVSNTGHIGLWEVIVSDRIFYTDSQASFLLTGNLIRIADDRNITGDSVRQIVQQRVSELPVANAVKIVRGKGTHRLFLFEDPNCPHCLALEKNLEQLDDVTIYSFLFPILSNDSRIKSQHIWCANNQIQKRKEYFALQNQQEMQQAPECQNPLDNNLQLGARLGVQGTPTLFFANGERLQGSATVDDLRQMIQRTKTLQSQPTLSKK